MRKFLALFLAAALLWAGARAPAGAQEVTIAALGDSLTQGYGLPQQDGFVPQLQRWLDARGEQAVLINSGVSGDTTAGGAARVAWTLTPEVDAMIVILGGNDLLRGIDPAVSRANLDTILKTASEAGVEVLLIGMEAPGNYGPDYKAEFEANYAELASRYGTLFMPSFLAGLAGPGADPAALMPLMQSDGIHPNAEGVSRLVEFVGPKVLELVAIARSGGQG
jgi:acyl-CoA thioesterase-1